MDGSVKICKVIKRQVTASIEEKENSRKIEGSTVLTLTKAQMGIPVDNEIGDEIGGESEVIEVEVKFLFDPVTQEVTIVDTDTEVESIEEDLAEEVNEDILDEEIGEIGEEEVMDDVVVDEEFEAEEAGSKIPGVPDGTGPGKDSPECPFNKEEEVTDEAEVEVAKKSAENKGESEASVEEGEVDINEFVEASNSVPEFEEVMIEGTALDISEEDKEGMTKQEVKEARKLRIAGIITRQRERQAALEIVEPGNYGYKRPLGEDTSSDPQDNNTKGPSPTMDSQSDTHKPEPKKEVQTLEGENPLQYQNNSVDVRRPKIPTQRELELQNTAVQQKDGMTFEGEPYSEQMKQNASYDLDEPEIPISKTTPHDNEDYSQEELRKPKIPTQTEGGRYELEFTASDKELYKKASKAAVIAEDLGLIESDEFDNKVEQLASAGEDYIDSYLHDIKKLSASQQNTDSVKTDKIARKEDNRVQGATSALFVPNEQSYEGESDADITELIASGFSIGGGASQKSVSLEDFKKMAAEEQE